MMTNGKQELAALLAGTARADRHAFAEFYAQTSRRVYGLICDVAADPSLRQRAMQDVYMLIWQRAVRYDPAVEDPITWTISLAHRHVVDQARTNDKGQSNEHEPIRMVYRFGMTYQKVAETLGLTEDTVKERIRDGVRNLEYHDTHTPRDEC